MLSNVLYKLSKTLTVILIIGSLMGCKASIPESFPTAPLKASTPESFPTAPLAVCQPSQIQTSDETSFSEIQATMHSDGEIWALLFFRRAYATEEAKIVWRITGAGVFTVQARHEDGTVISPLQSPQYHDGSNWERPGDEWGTGFNFPKPGCWTLTATRGTTIGEIALDVLPR